jgi:hypothetical protein
MYASDGMRPDLMEQYAAGRRHAHLRLADGEGRARRQRHGPGLPAQHRCRLVHDGHGHLSVGARLDEQHLPPHRRVQLQQPDELLGRRDTPGRHHRASAERAGKRVAQIEWVGGAQAGIAGPTVDFTNFFSTRGVLAAPLNAAEQSGAAAFGISYQVAAIRPASGWTNVPAGDPAAPPQQTALTVATTFAAPEPDPALRHLPVRLVADGTAAYDRVLLVRSGLAKDASQAARRSGRRLQGDQAARRADGLTGARAGQTAASTRSSSRWHPTCPASSSTSPRSSASSQPARRPPATPCPPEAPARTS